MDAPRGAVGASFGFDQVPLQNHRGGERPVADLVEQHGDAVVLDLENRAGTELDVADPTVHVQRTGCVPSTGGLLGGARLAVVASAADRVEVLSEVADEE